MQWTVRLETRTGNGEWAGGQHVGGAPASNPLQADQQRELTLHGRRQRQGMAHEVQHCHSRPRLSFVGTSLPVGRVRHDAATSFGHVSAGEEVDPRRTKAALGDISGHHLVTACCECAGHVEPALRAYCDSASQARPIGRSSSDTFSGIWDPSHITLVMIRSSPRVT